MVHEDFGIGIYQGLERLTFGGREGEFVFLKYKAKDKLYVPLDKLNVLHKYSGSELTPQVNRLYDGSWKRIRSRVVGPWRIV